MPKIFLMNKLPVNTLKFFRRSCIGVPTFIFGIFQDLISNFKHLDSNVARDVKLNGLHIFQEKISQRKIDELLVDFDALKNKGSSIRTGQLTGRIYAQGILTPLLGEYVDAITPYIKEILNSNNINVEISYYQESLPRLVLEEIPGGEFHVDDNRANIKFFIYLTDVNELNGPFSCVPGSGRWRLKSSILRGLLMEITRQRKYEYGFKLNYEELEKKELKVLGSAGTCFIVDTTSVHRASQVLVGARKVAVISFNRKRTIFWRA